MSGSRNDFFGTTNFPSSSSLNSLGSYSLMQLQNASTGGMFAPSLLYQAQQAQQVVNNATFTNPNDRAAAQRAANDLAHQSFMSSVKGPR